MRAHVANQALATDAEVGLRLWAEWGASNYTRDIGRNTAWIAHDPQHAAEVVLQYCSDGSAEPPLQQIGATWGKSDPAGGLRFAATLSGKKRAALGEALIRTWAEADPEAAAAFAAAQPDAAFRNALAPRLVERWGASDPTAALAWSQENLQGNARSEAIESVIKAAAGKDLTAASQLVADMEPGAVQNRACASIFETWFDKGANERDAAFAWLASLPDPAARTAALGKVQWVWILQDPDAVRDFIAGPHGDLASQTMVNQFARSEAARKPETALQWAGGLSEDRAAGARQAVLESWLQARPEAATDYARGLPAGPERETAIRTVTQTLLGQSPVQAAAWVRSLSAAEQMLALENLTQDRRRQIEAALK